MRRAEALAILHAHRTDLEPFGVKSLALFGSVARDEAGPESDLDLLLEFEGAATFDRYMGLKLLLEDLLGCRVDLVMRKALKARMLPSVEREAVRVARPSPAGVTHILARPPDSGPRCDLDGSSCASPSSPTPLRQAHDMPSPLRWGRRGM